MKKSRKSSARTYWSYQDCVTCRQFLRPFFLAFAVTLLLLAMLCGFLLVEQAAQQLGTADSKRIAVWEKKGTDAWSLEVMGYTLEPPVQIEETLSSFLEAHPYLIPAPLRLGAELEHFLKDQLLSVCPCPHQEE